MKVICELLAAEIEGPVPLAPDDWLSATSTDPAMTRTARSFSTMYRMVMAGDKGALQRDLGADVAQSVGARIMNTRFCDAAHSPLLPTAP